MKLLINLKKQENLLAMFQFILGIFNGANMLDDNSGYECVDILYDENDVRLYNF